VFFVSVVVPARGTVRRSKCRWGPIELIKGEVRRVQAIEAILFEPIGSLAEFPTDVFGDLAASVFGRPASASSGSALYWEFLDLLDAGGARLGSTELAVLERAELGAVARAVAYEDAIPALAELQGLGVRLIVASSLSTGAVTRFLDAFALGGFFSGLCSRDTAGGVKGAPLRHATSREAVPPDRAIFLTDTAAGLQAAREAGVHGILMMNDPDEAMKLTALNPAGGIVSLHELPDLVRLVAANASATEARGAR
jgi:beta-phosphoglucomutase-like phosphatase (HAD superfamily)